MIAIVATLKVAEGKNAEFEAIFTAHAQTVRSNEPGNLDYQLVKSRTDPQTYKVLEMYKDEAAVAAHRAADHQQALGPKLAGLMGGRPEIELLDGV
jgi:quinol monooxygenase YgiN